MKVLDIGCGKESRDLGYGTTIGIDLIGGDVIGDMCRLPFKDNSFDCAVANHSIEHTDKPREMLSEARRVLKNKGLLLINAPNLGAWFNRLLLLFGQEPPYAYEPRHYKCYTYSSLICLMGGFKVINHHTYGNERKGILGFLETLFSKLGMGSNISVLLQKKD